MLSIVTATFENHDELLRTLASTRSLRVPFENVVVNGGSCGDTAAFLRDSGHPHLSEPDRGIADAFNKGLRLARGDQILFLNSGDVLTDPGYLEAASAAFEAEPSLDFTYADIELAHYSGRTIPWRSGRPLPSMPYCHPTLVCRRTVFERVGGFDEGLRLAMDLDFAYRLTLGGFRGRYFPRPVVLMDGSGVSSRRHLLAYREKLGLIARYRRLDGAALRFVLLHPFKLLVSELSRTMLPSSWRARLRRASLR